ncbi:hypothetical protein B0H11DRAFT_2236491 [Mycena galericulata]|nr:hypothetical protein B0H11DRAFT_2236491 [Mycena galericulata]
MAALILVLQQAVHSQVLASNVPPTPEVWVSAMSIFLKDNEDPVQEMVHKISLEIAGIVDEIKGKDIIPVKIGRAWKFSNKEAEQFATKIVQCIEAHVI